MSYNSLITKANSNRFSILNRILDENLSNYNTSSFSSELNELTSEMLNYENLIENLKTDKRNVFSQLDYFQESKSSRFHNILYKEMLDKTNDLIKYYNLYKNILEAKKLAIQSKSKEIKQKLESLDSFSLAKKFSFKENFENMYYLSFNRIISTSLEVDTKANVVTLPVEEQLALDVRKIFIGSNSVGVAGNFYNGQNKFVYNLLNEFDDNGFEFFKVGTGPLKLILVFDLLANQILNQVDIVRNIDFNASNLSVKDITYFNDNKIVKIQSLIDTKYQSLDFKGATNKTTLSIKHLPVYASKVKIEFVVSEYSFFNEEKMYSLYLKSIKFLRNKYSNKGELNSSNITLRDNLFLVNAKMNSFPRKNSSIDTQLSLSIDTSGSFEQVTLDDNNVSSHIFLDGEAVDLNYKLNIEKNNNILEVLNPYEQENYFINPKTTQKIFSKETSPNLYAFTKDIKDNSLRIFQPKLAIRSSELEDQVILGSTSNNGVSLFVLPLNVNLLNIDIDDLRIYKNNNLLTKVNSQEELTEDSYFLSTNSKDIYVTNSDSKNITIGFLLKPKMPTVISQPEGYYVKIDEYFDYDKRNIKLKSYNIKNEIQESLLSTGSFIHFLKHSNIIENTFILQKLNPNTNQWETVLNTEYNLDAYSGTLYYTTEVEARVSYKHYLVKDLTNFEIWSNANEVQGVFIPSDDVRFVEITEPLNNTNEPIDTSTINLREVFEGLRNPLADPKKTFILSNTNIIKNSLFLDPDTFGQQETFEEIDYIDGFTEFLGLKHFEKDYIPFIEVNNNNQISFVLSQIPYSSNNFNIALYDGKHQKVTGYAASLNGKILTIVFNDNTYNGVVLSNWYLSYWYKSSDFKSYNTYSVNYETGVVYTSKEIEQSASFNVSYSIGGLSLNYHLIEPVTDYELDLNNKKITLYTENLNPQNSLIKFLWFDNEPDPMLKNLKDYFSPIVYSLEINGK